MKKALSFLYLIAAILVCLPLTSCGNSSKNKLVGRWEFSESIPDIDGTLNGTLTLKENDSFRADFVMTFKEEEEDGTKVQMTVTGYKSGEWDVIGDDMLYCDASSCDAKVSNAKIYTWLTGWYNADSSDLEELNAMFIGAVKAALFDTSTDDIISLEANSFTTRDDDGTTVTYTRVD